jgi:hypothetical protein
MTAIIAFVVGFFTVFTVHAFLGIRMSMWTRTSAPIKHRTWVIGAARSIKTTVRLYEHGSIPTSIETPMIVVPVKRLLRGVYGSDLAAALALLFMALRVLPGQFMWAVRSFWLFTVLRKDRQTYLDGLLKELDMEDVPGFGE